MTAAAVTLDDAIQFAQSEFGHAQLGDKRRTSRLVRRVATLITVAASKISEVFTTKAEQESAYRFVENYGIDPDMIGEAAYQASAKRCHHLPRSDDSHSGRARWHTAWHLRTILLGSFGQSSQQAGEKKARVPRQRDSLLA